MLLNVWQSKAEFVHEDDIKEVEHFIEVLGNIEQRYVFLPCIVSQNLSHANSETDGTQQDD